jgi:hypothetical protein
VESEKMDHICYAIAKDGCVQLDTRDKSLEIYEDINDAEINCPDDMEIVKCFVELDGTKVRMVQRKKEAFEAIWDSVTDALPQVDIDHIEEIHKQDFEELYKD